MSEKVLGVIEVMKSELKLLDNSKLIRELLGITPNSVFILPQWEQHFARAGYTAVSRDLVGIILDTIEHSEANRKTKRSKEKMREREEEAKTLEELFQEHARSISNSEITKVELKKGWFSAIKLNIITRMEKHKWNIVPKKGVKTEDYENILRPAFGDKLSVKK